MTSDAILQLKPHQDLERRVVLSYENRKYLIQETTHARLATPSRLAYMCSCRRVSDHQHAIEI